MKDKIRLTCLLLLSGGLSIQLHAAETHPLKFMEGAWDREIQLLHSMGTILTDRVAIEVLEDGAVTERSDGLIDATTVMEYDQQTRQWTRTTTFDDATIPKEQSSGEFEDGELRLEGTTARGQRIKQRMFALPDGRVKFVEERLILTMGAHESWSFRESYYVKSGAIPVSKSSRPTFDIDSLVGYWEFPNRGNDRQIRIFSKVGDGDIFKATFSRGSLRAPEIWRYDSTENNWKLESKTGVLLGIAVFGGDEYRTAFRDLVDGVPNLGVVTRIDSSRLNFKIGADSRGEDAVRISERDLPIGLTREVMALAVANASRTRPTSVAAPDWDNPTIEGMHAYIEKKFEEQGGFRIPLSVGRRVEGYADYQVLSYQYDDCTSTVTRRMTFTYTGPDYSYRDDKDRWLREVRSGHRVEHTLLLDLRESWLFDNSYVSMDEETIYCFADHICTDYPRLALYVYGDDESTIRAAAGAEHALTIWFNDAGRRAGVEQAFENLQGLCSAK